MSNLRSFRALAALLLLPLLSLVLQSCGMSQGVSSRSNRAQPTEAEVQRRLRADYGDAFDLAGAQFAELVMKKIAPRSGKELQHSINLYPVWSNEDESAVACALEVRFLARDYWSGVSYGTCVLQGVLTLGVPRYRGRPYEVIVNKVQYNEQLQKVSKPAQLQWLEEGVRFNLKMR
ncbi:hypothetical protein [Porphyromonas sp.]